VGVGRIYLYSFLLSTPIPSRRYGMKHKSNKGIQIDYDPTKSYVYITDRNVLIGILAWNYRKKVWEFNRGRITHKMKR